MRYWIAIFTLFFCGCVHARPALQPRQLPVAQWIMEQTQSSESKLMQNISPPDGAPGSVIASPSRWAPPYYYHWTRDSALAYMTVLHLYQASRGDKQKKLKEKILEFADFSSKLQANASLGEPKFELDGRPFAGGWCRPQTDGPALRAVTLLQAARVLENTDRDAVEKHLFPVIKKDVEFVKNNWRSPSCDLWEEVDGDHFYTRMTQRRALIDAAAFSSELKQDATDLLSEAHAIQNELIQHWDEQRGYLVATLHRTGGLDYKTSNLDASIILAVLHGHTNDNFMSYLDPQVLQTAEKLLSAFHALYPVNQAAGTIGTAIGRYPEDRYTGKNFNGGNPWVLLTAAMAQYYYKVAQAYSSRGADKDASIAYFKAEDLLRRVQYHAPADGALAEQIDRQNGFMTSAADLTWSHTEVLEMFAARSQSTAKLHGNKTR